MLSGLHASAWIRPTFPRNRNDFVAGMSPRDGHRPVVMAGGDEIVVRAPRPCADTAGMGYFIDQAGLCWRPRS